METVKNFFSDYGYSFLMMVVIGFVTALITEITIKKALDWLEAKLDGHERMLAILKVVRTLAIQMATWLMVLAFTKILTETMALPGGKVFYPVWLCLVYVIQYLFSCWGIKGIQSLIEKKAQKALDAPAAPAVKKDPLEGLTKLSENCYTDGNGNYFNKKGKKI